MTTQSAAILHSETRSLKSVSTGREYQITVSLPYGYGVMANQPGPFFQTGKWPVVYLLDANWYLGMVTDTVRAAAWHGRSTDAVIVGIGYPETNRSPQEMWLEAQRRRALDFTPFRDEATEKAYSEGLGRPTRMGGAEGFHTFIESELIPLIEREYQVDSTQSTLVGHSFAGLFTAYALLRQPDLFRTYVIASPAFVYGDRYMFRYEEEFARKHKQLRAQAYFTAGENEEFAGWPLLTEMLRFVAVLESRQYRGLRLVKQVFLGQDHMQVVAPAFHGGLMWALRKENGAIPTVPSPK